jgi:hypothetical protein
MSELTQDFFKTLFSKDHQVDPDILLPLFDQRVMQEMNENLCKDFTEEEIGDALFQISPLKAPGPDGFLARFFQRNWGTMKGEVTQAVNNFFRSGIMPDMVNDTTIVMIPKVPHPEKLSEFRPISLCDVLYKIVSKCMVNRLRLDDMISPN